MLCCYSRSMVYGWKIVENLVFLGAILEDCRGVLGYCGCIYFFWGGYIVGYKDDLGNE